MNPERWQKVKQLLQEALELAPSERSHYLDSACGADAELRREVQSLVASYQTAGDFLDDAGAREAAAPARARSLTQAGPYQVLREIGRGGMGDVYLVNRDGDSASKPLALKLLRHGLENELVQKRFRHEWQILANLRHPNIASLFDVGTASDGRPYFVMEYIDGLPIDQYCDRRRLSTRERLQLFCKVCSAVEFAHQSRIIHRDIKPGNILIDTSGEPKLLDFGIAKILDPEFTGETIDPTVTQLRMMTPEYASPEQIRGEPATAAADIYSLGVLLYELLTGHKPYRVRSRSPHEMAHAICEQDPERPSTAVKRVEQITRGVDTQITVTPEAVSEARSTVPAQLRKTLSGDVDCIVLTALRKEPERRYATAGELADDIERHLQGRAVRARPDSLLYRGARFIHRNGSVVLAAGIAALAAALAMYVIERERVRNAPLSDFTQARTTPFTTFSGDESQAAFSPDGKHIAFVWKGDRNDNPDIYVKETGGARAPLRLTSSPAEDTSPVWSPDGKRIAFLRTTGEDAGFYVVPPDGKQPERMVARASSVSYERLGRGVGWTRNGESLLIADRPSADRPFAIYELPLAGGTPRQVTNPPPKSVGDVALAAAPDGSAVAFIRVPNSGVAELFVRTSSGSERQLTNDRRWIVALTWSPDSSEVLFVSNRTGNPAIWRVDADGGNPTRLAGVGQNVSDPAFSSDGTRLAYSQITVDANIWRYDVRSRRLESLIVSTQYDASPFYSPDGKRIAFRSTRSGTSEIWVADADGTNATQLTSHRGPLTGTPRWSPDGRWIAYDSRPEGTPHIYIIPAAGGTPRRFTDVGAENVVPSFSADSSFVYFASNRGGSWQVWKKPLDGGPAVQVTRGGGFAAFESPDGRFVYYAKSRTAPGLWRVPVASGPEEVVLPELKAGYWGYWAISTRGVVFVDKESAATPAVIWLLDPGTRRRTALGQIAKPLTLATSALTVSPDGRWVAFGQQDHSSSDIMLAEAAER